MDHSTLRAGLVCLVALAACASSGITATPTVHAIVDGDTLEIDFGGTTEIVRLLGIDTPESVDPSRPVQCFGPESTARLGALLPPGAAVRIERDQEARDHYGRLLAYAFREADGLFVNEVLLDEGFADIAVIAPNTAYRERLLAAVTRARTTRRGLWRHCGGPDVAVDPPPPSP